MESDDSGDRLKAVTSKVSAELRDQIDAARKPEETRSAAIRRLVRAGLEAEEQSGLYDRAGRAVVLGLLMGYPTLAAARGSMTVATGWIGAMILFTLLEPYLTGAISGFGDALKWWK